MKPIDYVLIALANHAGKDKLDWQDRIKWAKDNLEMNHEEAEEPMGFLKAKKAYQEALEGKPSGFLVSLDATSSGLQILAALTKDDEAAKICNIHSTGHREDAYTIIYNRMKEYGASDGVKRADVKQAIMTSLYGSRKVPKETFGEEDYEIFLDVINDSVKRVWLLNEEFLDAWNPEALEYRWMLPDGFEVIDVVEDSVKKSIEFDGQYYDIFVKVNQPKAVGLSLAANVTHSLDGYIVRELVRRAKVTPVEREFAKVVLSLPAEPKESKRREIVHKLWNLYKETGMLSASILQYLDVDTSDIVDKKVVLDLIDNLPKNVFDIVCIHDCFKVHPNYCEDLRLMYKRMLYEISQSTFLEYLSKELCYGFTTYAKDEAFSSKILESEYAIC